MKKEYFLEDKKETYMEKIVCACLVCALTIGFSVFFMLQITSDDVYYASKNYNSYHSFSLKRGI